LSIQGKGGRKPSIATGRPGSGGGRGRDYGSRRKWGGGGGGEKKKRVYALEKKGGELASYERVYPKEKKGGSLGRTLRG